MKDGKIELIENGKEKEYSIVFSFEQNSKNYIVYTDNSVDSDGFIKTYAGEYVKDGEAEKLLPIDDEKILTQIENLLSKIDGEESK